MLTQVTAGNFRHFLKAGVHKFQATKFCTVGPQYGTLHNLSGTWNFELAPRFLDNMCTL